MDEKSFTRGSEWRKWDLHIHTPLSICQEYGGDKEDVWEKFITSLEQLPPDVKVIGINDYYFIDGYEKVMDYKSKGRLSNISKIFPILEFRIDTFGSGNENNLQKINLHILFNVDENDLNNELKTIREEFIDQIKISSLEAHRTKKLSKENFINIADNLQAGFNSLIPSTKEVLNIIESDTWENKTFLFLGYKEWSNLEKNQQIKPLKEDLYSKVGAFFSSNANNIEENQQWLNEFGNKRLLHSLDIHSFNNLKKENYHCHTWIKADPTFEGLKQIIYEPEERVRIQQNNPKLDYDKPYFSSIIFKDDEKIFKDDELYFDKSTQEIPLNPNLVAIIGGRGEGKSMLMKYISTSFAIETIETNEDFFKSGNIEVIHSKTIKNEKESLSFPIANNEKYPLDFIYISQGELKNIIEKRQLAEGISKMANIKEIVFDQNLDKEISDRLTELHNIKGFLNDSQNNLEELKKQEKNQRQFIENITTKENREKLEQYTKILESINIKTDKKKQLLNLEDVFHKKEIELNENICSINKRYNLSIPTVQKELSFKLQSEKIQELLKSIEEYLVSLNQEKEKIRSEFNQFYTGDLTTLLKDVDKYQNELSLISDKIETVKEATAREKNLFEIIFKDIENRLSLVSKIKAEYKKQEKSILEDWERFKNIEQREDLNSQKKKIMQTLLQDLDIEAVTEFNKEAFYNEIYHCINGSEWRVKNNKKAQENYFKVVNLDTYFQFVKENYFEVYYESGIYGNTLKDILFKEEKRRKYIKVYPILKYKGKNLDKISIGQKGTVYLKMKLATEAFSKPIIFDQPEDDLDNQFIIRELVDLFKELKKYRQVIIITHNANLVINADAEQVIVAKNDNEKLKYTSGSLENIEINKQICEILEGGKEAFKNRERKYGF